MLHHFSNEIIAILIAIPFTGYALAKMHAWYYNRPGHECACKYCHDTHTEVYIEYSEEDLEWDAISKEEAVERFGDDFVNTLTGSITGREFDWFVNSQGHLKAIERISPDCHIEPPQKDWDQL